MSALVFEAVSARYGARRVLDAVSCAFESGCVTGLAGPNGAGKTTLLRAALGLIKPASGRIFLQERALSAWTPEASARTIAYLPQVNDAHWPLLAHRVVALGRLPHRAALSRLSAEDEAAIDSALERCDARQLAGRRMDQLSSGERARVLLARALATAAPVLLVDEPAAHLDPGHQLQLMALLREEAARGTAVVVTLHDLSLASRFCDGLVLMRDGHVAAQGAPHEALNSAALEAVFGVGALHLSDAAGRDVVIVTQI